MQEEKQALEEFGSTDSGASLGDILGAALKNAKKAKEEKAEEKPAKKKTTKKKAEKEEAVEASEEKAE